MTNIRIYINIFTEDKIKTIELDDNCVIMRREEYSELKKKALILELLQTAGILDDGDIEFALKNIEVKDVK